MSDYKPKLRMVEVIPVESRGEEFLLMRDRAGFAADSVLPAMLGPLLSLFDGDRTQQQIIDDYAAMGGEDLPTWFVQQVVDQLDERLLLDSPYFHEQKSQTLRNYASTPTRESAFAGLSYPDDPAELRALLGSFFMQATALHSLEGVENVRGMVVPHIDFRRGGPVEALAYRALQNSDCDVYVVLGIAHCGVRYHFCATPKSYETPLGTCETDTEFVAALQRRVGEQLVAEQFAHKGEHSIEFVSVFLKYLENTTNAKIVPILCGGFHADVQRKTSPARNHEIAQFSQALRDTVRAWEAKGKRVGFIASVDLSHVGTQFGDDETLTPERLSDIEREDRTFLACAERGDAEALHMAMAKDGNARNVDAHPALYTLLHAFPELRGQLLHYAQAYDSEANSVVSFASMALL